MVRHDIYIGSPISILNLDLHQVLHDGERSWNTSCPCCPIGSCQLENHVIIEVVGVGYQLQHLYHHLQSELLYSVLFTENTTNKNSKNLLQVHARMHTVHAEKI